MYKYQEFPRCVYGPEGATRIIYSEDERPDGFVNHADELVDGAVMAAAEAEVTAKAAEKALRDGYKDFLDRHAVSYSRNLSTPKLESLVKQLEAYLAAQEQPTDDNRA